MNRADLIHTRMAAEAIARIVKLLLEAEATQEWVDNESRVVWDVPGATAAAAIKQRSLEVIDDQAFFAWLREHHPTEVIEVLRVRNPEWLANVRAGLAGQIARGAIDPPPGTKLDEGGRFHALAVTPDAGVRHALDAVVKAYLATGRTSFTPAGVWEAAAKLLAETNAAITQEAVDGPSPEA